MIEAVVVREMGLIVETLAQKMAGYEGPGNTNPRPLTDFNADIKTINYIYGHTIEQREKLQQMSESPEYRSEKYPAVLLVEDIRIRSGGDHRIATLNIYIVMGTEPNYDSSDRQQKNFDEILIPIYNALMDGIYRWPFFRTYNRQRDMPHTRIDRKYWGREIVGGTDANKLTDYLDAIEVANLELKLSNKHC